MWIKLLLLAVCWTSSGGETFEETNFVEASALSESETTTASSPAVLNESEDRISETDDEADGGGGSSILERPKNLVVVAASQRSISLRWDFSPATGNIEGYRIYYVHENFKDVKTVLKATPAYDLHGLGKKLSVHIKLNCFKISECRIKIMQMLFNLIMAYTVSGNS